VDSAIAVLIGHLFLDQAAANERKKTVVRRFVGKTTAGHPRDLELVCSGDTAPLLEYDVLAGPVPANS
jgi:hypothetical protein